MVAGAAGSLPGTCSISGSVTDHAVSASREPRCSPVLFHPRSYCRSCGRFYVGGSYLRLFDSLVGVPPDRWFFDSSDDQPRTLLRATTMCAPSKSSLLSTTEDRKPAGRINSLTPGMLAASLQPPEEIRIIMRAWASDTPPPRRRSLRWP